MSPAPGATSIVRSVPFAFMIMRAVSGTPIVAALGGWMTWLNKIWPLGVHDGSMSAPFAGEMSLRPVPFAFMTMTA